MTILTGQTRATGGSNPTALSTGALVAILVVLLAVSLGFFVRGAEIARGPSGTGLAADLGMLVGAAQVMKDGGNPFDYHLLYRTERLLLHRQSLPITPDEGITRVGNPPLYLWAFRPLTVPPFRTVGYVWLATLVVLVTGGFVLLLRFFGWNRWFVPVLVFLLMPQVVHAVYHGNSVVLVFAAVAASLALSHRHPYLAGSIVVLAWIKPQIGLIPVLLMMLFHIRHRRRFLAGFLIGTATLSILMSIVTGPISIVQWIRGLTGYSHDLAPQHVVPSLAGLYVLWAPWPLRVLLSALGLAMTGMLTAFWWRKLRGAAQVPFMAVAWLWLVWFIATPYVHIDDEVVLAIPLIALVGRNGSRLPELIPTFGIYLIFFAPGSLGWGPVEVLLPILLMVVCTRPHSRSDLRWALLILACLSASILVRLVGLPVDAGSFKLLALTVCFAVAAIPALRTLAGDESAAARSSPAPRAYRPVRPGAG